VLQTEIASVHISLLLILLLLFGTSVFRLCALPTNRLVVTVLAADPVSVKSHPNHRLRQLRCSGCQLAHILQTQSRACIHAVQHSQNVQTHRRT